MLTNYLPLQFELQTGELKGFCIKISDEFFLTYAVILDGYQSFCIWLDPAKSTWCASKNANIHPDVLNKIIYSIS